MLYKGKVERIQEKTGRGKNGKPYTLYSLVLETSAGPAFLGTGFDKPNAPPGAVVEVEADENARGYLDADLKTLRVLKEETSPAPEPKAVASGVSAMDTRQRSIVAQSSYKTAADVLAVALTNEAIKLPKAKSAATDALDTLLEAHDRIAQHIFNKTINGLTLSEEDEEEIGTEEGEYDPLS